MDPGQLFLSNLALIDRVIGRICRRAHLYDADAEDFASRVKLALIDDDYAILRKWEGGSLPTFLAVVIQRMMVDEWRSRGRWIPSAEARRLGPAAVTLETLIARDGRPLAEAAEATRTIHRDLTVMDLERISAALPHRDPPRRTVPMPGNADDVFVAPHAADDRAREDETRRVADHTSRVVADALAAMPLEDRMLIRFRFASSMTIADIARVMGVPQRPLYRRLESLLSTLKRQLANEGIDAGALADVIGRPALQVDFGWKSDEPLPSTPTERTETSREHAP